MNKKVKTILLVLLFILLFAGIVGIVLYVATEKKEVTVYDWSRTIVYDEKSNYQLTEKDIKEGTVLAADVREDYITNKQEIVGMYLTGTAYKDSAVLRSQLSKDPTYIDKGGISELANYRKYYLRVDMNGAFAGDIKAGDIVDILFTESSSGFTAYRTEEIMGDEVGLNYTQSRLIMQGIPVYQVYTADGSVYQRRETDPVTLNKYAGTQTVNDEKQKDYSAPSFVALTVTVPQYEELVARSHVGTISMVSRFDGSSDQETEGYIVIKGSNVGLYAGSGNLDYVIDLDETMTGLPEKGEGGDGETVEWPVKSEEPAETKTAKVNNNLPGLYSFIKTLAKISMTDTQKDQYNSIYTRYAKYMDDFGGTEWEINKPDETTMDMLMENVDANDETAMRNFLAWRNDLETLAKELRGASVLLPW